MPAPQAMMMQELAKTQFRTFAIKLPTSWKPDLGYSKTYPDAFAKSELSDVPMPMPPALFLPATTNKLHVSTQKNTSNKIAAFIDGICSAICSAWSQWQSTTTMVGVLVNGPTASMGQVVGVPWLPLILASAPKATPMEAKYSMAIANAISNGWMTYQNTIKVPGLPWYPAFAALPSPVAPPTPNIPTPVAALTQVPVSVSKMPLKQMMIGNLADPTAPHHQELFDSVADAFDKCFKIWQVSTQVTNVLGTGPVPTFAPPYVPVGPVLGGVGTMAPGGFV